MLRGGQAAYLTVKLFLFLTIFHKYNYFQLIRNIRSARPLAHPGGVIRK